MFNYVIERLFVVLFRLRNHNFDIINVGEKKGRQGEISGFYEQPKGVKPVRHHYKIHETYILPSMRLGMSEEEL